jgi:predicted Zn-dependent protease
MTREQEDLLWRILREYPDARWAQAGLEQLYFKAGNTAGLYQLYLKQQPYYPTNDLLRNNLAAAALLLKTNLPQARQWASEVYARNTNNPVVVATFAYSLHLQGRDQEGIAAFRKLKPEQLDDPSAALYYGLLLSATGKPDEAAPYLEIARTRGQLLPEERQLLPGMDKKNQLK